MALIPEGPAWLDDDSRPCLGHNALFFPPIDEQLERGLVKWKRADPWPRARVLCAQCHRRPECTELALSRGVTQVRGFQAGLDPYDQVQEIRRRRVLSDG